MNNNYLNAETEADSIPYLSEDKSIVTPYLKKYVWTPLLRFVPLSSSANTMTLLSQVCAIMAFILLFTIPNHQSFLYFIPAIFLFLYMTIDNMDGAQARRTGTSSPLGEFLDHWNDGFTSCMISFSFFFVMEIPIWAIIILTILINMSVFCTFWEQRRTGWLRFGTIGGVEGILLIILALLLMTFLGKGALNQYQLVGSWTFMDFYLIIAFIGMPATIFQSVNRVRGHYWDLIPHFVYLGSCSLWFATGSISTGIFGFLMILGTMFFGGRLIISRVLRKSFKAMCDPILTILLLFVTIILSIFQAAPQIQTAFGVMFLFYVSIHLIWDFWNTTAKLSNYIRPTEFLAMPFARYLHKEQPETLKK